MPGSFPTEFATAILQLKQQKEQKAAELSEMRNQRAASNFLEQQRINLQEQGQALQAQQFGQSQAAQQERAKMDADLQREAGMARIKLETERMKQEQDQSVARSLQDFGRTGTAFIPTHASAEIPKLLSSSNSSDPNSYTTIDVPGIGTIVQRINDPENQAKLAELRAHTQALSEKAAVDHAHSLYYQTQNDTYKQKLENATTMVDEHVASNAQKQFNDYRQLAKTSMLGAAAKGDDALAARIAADPAEAFAEGSKEREGMTNAQLLIQAWQRKQLQPGLDSRSGPDVQGLKALGLDGAAFGSAPGVKVVGRITDEAGSTFFIGEHGEKIPTNDKKTLVSQVGTVPLGSTAPPPAPTPATPGQQDAERQLTAVIRDPKSTPAQKQAAAAQIKRLRAALVK